MNGFEYFIYFNLACWIVFFCYHIIKGIKKAIKEKKPFKVEKLDILMWSILSICSSIFGPVTTVFVGFFVLAGLIGKAWEWFEEHWLDNIVEYLGKEVTIKK